MTEWNDGLLSKVAMTMTRRGAEVEYNAVLCCDSRRKGDAKSKGGKGGKAVAGHDNWNQGGQDRPLASQSKRGGPSGLWFCRFASNALSLSLRSI